MLDDVTEWKSDRISQKVAGRRLYGMIYEIPLIVKYCTHADAWKRARTLGYWKGGVDYIHPPFLQGAWNCLGMLKRPFFNCFVLNYIQLENDKYIQQVKLW